MSEKINIDYHSMSDSAILKIIGSYVRHNRLEQNKTQDQLAHEAGINRWTIGKIESGKSVALRSLIQVLRVLNLLHILDVFTVEEKISPIEYAKLREKKRKRARPKKEITDSNEGSSW